MTDPAFPPTSRPPRRLLRSRDDRMVAGVCGGLASYAGIDPTVLRVLAVVFGLIFFPVVPLVYLVLWAVIPQQ